MPCQPLRSLGQQLHDMPCVKVKVGKTMRRHGPHRLSAALPPVADVLPGLTLLHCPPKSIQYTVMTNLLL